MHLWGEPGVDWEGINEAAEYIGHYLRKRGMVVLGVKEKYGEVRVSVAMTTGRVRGYIDRFLYRRAYKLALRRWPHLRCELLEGADWPEYLRRI